MHTVLLVEDNDDARTMYSLSLEFEGFQVLAVGSATRALELVTQQTPDVIVTDVSMPDMDGVELCRRLRALPQLRTVPILAVTGHSSDSALYNVSAAGACALCTKPLPGDSLATAVRSLLAERTSCLGCWVSGAGFRLVQFGPDLAGWMRHEPLEPEG